MVVRGVHFIYVEEGILIMGKIIILTENIYFCCPIFPIFSGNLESTSLISCCEARYTNGKWCITNSIVMTSLDVIGLFTMFLHFGTANQTSQCTIMQVFNVFQTLKRTFFTAALLFAQKISNMSRCDLFLPQCSYATHFRPTNSERAQQDVRLTVDLHLIFRAIPLKFQTLYMFLAPSGFTFQSSISKSFHFC